MAVKNEWEMIDEKIGYVVYENSFPSGLIRCYFSFEDVPPLEEYKEGKEYWKYIGSAQSLKFNLKNKTTGEVVQLNELMGIMYPTIDDPDNNVYQIQQIAENNKIFIYIALTYRDPSVKGRKLTDEQLTALNEYFNNRLRSPGKKILILPENICGDPSKCKGEILTDIGLTTYDEKK